MKKKIALTAGALVVATTLGLGIYHSDASHVEPTLTTEDVESLVADQYPGTITDMELEKDFNKAVYEVEIEGEGKKYKLKLDGSSGEVLELKEKTVMNTAEKEKPSKENEDQNLTVKEKKDDTKQDKKQEKQDKKEGKESNKKSNQNNNDKKALMDTSEASEIALNEFSGTITDLELDEEDGRLIYEIEIEDGEQEAEMEIDAHTGEILVIEIDD
ncbi:MAG TPA: PepSY domain-containing protein [Candidatus Avamphibacillus sp.]|nr:PepSY domain-containing protein [Candidatus Avamphibacillus sp.]